MTTNPVLLKTFDERVIWFLSHLYEQGGNEYKAQNYTADRSYRIPGTTSPDEFNRMMKSLKSKGWATWDLQPQQSGHPHYVSVLLTEDGITEAKKALPQIPLFGLISQEITTGDSDTDVKINHARTLFFSNPSKIEHMRSACVALCAVLEPIRYELTPAVTKADMNDLFQLINRFDIRHNNDGVTQLKYPEQLEWVFYSLLNTINAYTKLKKRLQG